MSVDRGLFDSANWIDVSSVIQLYWGSGDKAKLARMLALILGGVNGVKTWTVGGRGSSQRHRHSRPFSIYGGACGHSVVAFNAESAPKKKSDYPPHFYPPLPSPLPSFVFSVRSFVRSFVHSFVKVRHAIGKWTLLFQRLREHRASKCSDTFLGANHRWNPREWRLFGMFLSASRKVADSIDTRSVGRASPTRETERRSMVSSARINL